MEKSTLTRPVHSSWQKLGWLDCLVWRSGWASAGQAPPRRSLTIPPGGSSPGWSITNDDAFVSSSIRDEVRSQDDDKACEMHYLSATISFLALISSALAATTTTTTMSVPPGSHPHGDAPQDLTEALIELLVGPKNTGIRAQVHQNALTRGNTPSAGLAGKVHLLGPPPPGSPQPLWMVDRLLEPQTMVHFLQSALHGVLPGGSKSSLPLVHPEVVQLLSTPPSQWAPAPYNTKPQPYMFDIMTRIGSHEDNTRLQVVSKDLHFQKSRAWEGIVPMSDRHWAEQELDHPSNFPQACQHITALIDVFLYLNLDHVKHALRTTYNLIHDHLGEFEKALEAKYAAETAAAATTAPAPPDSATAATTTTTETKPTTTSTSTGDDDDDDDAYVEPPRGPAKLTEHWAEYMTVHFAHMETRAHAWATAHLDTLKQGVLSRLQAHQQPGPPDAQPNGPYDELQWLLTNMWQDLVENQAYVDCAMFIPLDGYHGMKPGLSATGRPTNQTVADAMDRERRGGGAEPDDSAGATLPGQQGLSRPMYVDPDIQVRMTQYHLKRRELQMLHMMNHTMANLLAGIPSRPDRPLNDPADILLNAQGQDVAQRQTRVLLRGGDDRVAAAAAATAAGQKKTMGKESWVLEGETMHSQIEVVLYRTYHGHDDDDWNKFVEKFEADNEDWGKELVGTDKLRAKMKLTWRNVVGELDLEGVEAVKKHFNDNISEDVHGIDFVLFADEASIESYLNPVTTTTTATTANASGTASGATQPKLLPGDVGGFILAVDVQFDPSAPPHEHSDESPEYAGEVRLRGSLLWDNVMPASILQSESIEDLWPMARVHPRKMYTGPVVKAQLAAWGAKGLGGRYSPTLGMHEKFKLNAIKGRGAGGRAAAFTRRSNCMARRRALVH
ncbi:uncharacterized protein B0I36DRAFT_436315 [Microdochium trichocladiopsis]|uniref:Uncharacterized protein n=1 Tax=Microdochium trichocladiopsis TaxID=1682393 RepID=A0A9P8XRV5_9PEZI|nr:uncharacterized protein B0I36DRAFT_436315 [Microdochium trichocladiopsis]KAH7014257.1 hypothetical protein B0I36DRAFT_436315 [Microdochium trichocladiopsis]